MNNNDFVIPDNLLELASGGASGTVMLGEAENTLESGKCPYCGADLMQISQSGQQSGTGNIISFYACSNCFKIFQKITYLSGKPLWGEMKF